MSYIRKFVGHWNFQAELICKYHIASRKQYIIKHDSGAVRRQINELQISGAHNDYEIGPYIIMLVDTW